MISGAEWIRDYEQLMTPARVRELASSVTVDLFRWFQQRAVCDGVFVNVSRDYAPALAGLGEYCRRHSIPYAEAAGSMGLRLAQMKAWLVGGGRDVGRW